MPYLFKDTEMAARRLHLVAEVFAPSSRTFLQQVVERAPEVAFDLGCGPGYTTRLLAEVTQCACAIGLDSSEHFLSLAREQAPPNLSFVRHNVTEVPFPMGAGDLIFCRLLLTHLRDPLSALARWETQLHTDGVLLVEEVEWIQTEHPLLRRYLEIQAALLRQQGNELYVGPLLTQYRASDDLRSLLSRVFSLPVSTTQAAKMFSMNLLSWKGHPFIRQQYGTVIDDIEQGLQELASHADSEGQNIWGMRQLAYVRK